MTYSILSLDGGGIFGCLTARLLCRLAEEVPEYFANVNLYAGTSIGGINAVGLAVGYSPQDLLHFYTDYSKLIFTRTPLQSIKSGFGLWGAKYSNEGLKKALTDLFGQKKISDLKKHILIPTFDLDGSEQGERQWQTQFISNLKPVIDDPLIDVCLRTSAAPTLFPAYQGYIDGGITVNNPSMCALSEAINAGVPQDAVRLLSVGTGLGKKFIEGSPNWGLVQWAKPVIEAMLLAGEGIAQYHCQSALHGAYCKLNCPAPDDVGLDDYKAIPKILDYADLADISVVATWAKGL